VREQCGVVPAVLADPKLGWAGCATVGVGDALAPFLRHVQRQDEARRNRGAALRRASAAAALDAFGHGRGSGGIIDYGGDDSDGEDADAQAAEQQQPPSTVVDALVELARGARSAAASALAASAAFGPAAPASFGPAEAWAEAWHEAWPGDDEKAASPGSRRRRSSVAANSGSLAWLNASCDAFERSAGRGDDRAALAALAAASSAAAVQGSGDAARDHADAAVEGTAKKAAAPKTASKKRGSKAKLSAEADAEPDEASASEVAAAAAAAAAAVAGALGSRNASELKVLKRH